jgi:N-dimethylarginine dimethylaminohydrolase
LDVTLQSDVAPLRRVVLKHARDAFVSAASIDEQWASLDWLAAPDLDAACRESDAFAALFESLGVAVEWLPADDAGLDSIYVRDPALVSDAGVVLARMGKPARATEPAPLGRGLARLGLHVRGQIEAPGTFEGGDVVWLSRDTLVVGRGKRTNADGIAQVVAMLPGVDILTLPLPEWDGSGDVFHLMSALSPLAENLALVYPPLLPGTFLTELRARGFTLVEVPASELDTQGPNVLAVAPRVAVALEGNPETKRRMEAAGVEVHTYRGDEISKKRCGGPTCLTRPLEREV